MEKEQSLRVWMQKQRIEAKGGEEEVAGEETPAETGTEEAATQVPGDQVEVAEDEIVPEEEVEGGDTDQQEVVKPEIVPERVEPLCGESDGGCTPTETGTESADETTGEEEKGGGIDIDAIEGQIITASLEVEEVDVEGKEVLEEETTPAQEEVIVPEQVDVVGETTGTEQEIPATGGEVEVHTSAKDADDTENMGENGEQQEVVETNKEPTDQEGEAVTTVVSTDTTTTSPTTTTLKIIITSSPTTTTLASEPDVDNVINDTKQNQDTVTEPESEDEQETEEPIPATEPKPVLTPEAPTTTTTKPPTPGPTCKCSLAFIVNIAHLSLFLHFWQHT